MSPDAGCCSGRDPRRPTTGVHPAGGTDCRNTNPGNCRNRPKFTPWRSHVRMTPRSAGFAGAESWRMGTLDLAGGFPRNRHASAKAGRDGDATNAIVAVGWMQSPLQETCLGDVCKRGPLHKESWLGRQPLSLGRNMSSKLHKLMRGFREKNTGWVVKRAATKGRQEAPARSSRSSFLGRARRAASDSPPSGCRPLPIAPASARERRGVGPGRQPPLLKGCFGWVPTLRKGGGGRERLAHSNHPRRGWQEVLNQNVCVQPCRHTRHPSRTTAPEQAHQCRPPPQGNAHRVLRPPGPRLCVRSFGAPA